MLITLWFVSLLQALLQELRRLPQVPEDPWRGVRAVPVLQEDLHLAVPQRVGRQVGRPEGRRHLPRQNISSRQVRSCDPLYAV